jgi:hypothetical protein
MNILDWFRSTMLDLGDIQDHAYGMRIGTIMK